MKNIVKYFAAVGAGCLMMTSCDNDEFLSTTLYDILQPDVQFSNDDNGLMGLNGIYTFNNVSKFDNSWGYKPNIFTGSHPTMDTQCTGWDVKFLDQTWDANVGELGEGWAHAYAAISRANIFLDNLQTAPDYDEFSKMGITKACRATLEGEAKALRGYFYMWLATTFGRVPMLQAGEDYSNTPVKAAAETYEEMWDFIIGDFKDAANLLQWTPYKNNYGRCTKGMALAYLADAYMWKAYRLGCDNEGVFTQAQSDSNGEAVKALYTEAKNCLKQVIDSKTYKLSTNFATNWDPAGFWNEECIWAMVSDEGSEWTGGGAWGGDRTITFCNPNMFKWFTACTENGGWGAQYLSWEWYACYEKGDLRRDASCVTGEIDPALMAKFDIEVSEYVHGNHPYLQCHVGSEEANASNSHHFHNGEGELAPSIWTSKFWRNAYADGNSWGDAIWSPTIIYGKRYANVLIDYAECCFRTGNPSEGWSCLDEIRNRAWGNLQVGEDYSKYCVFFNELYATVKYDLTMTSYPLVAKSPSAAPSAQSYYSTLASTPNRKGYTHTSPDWLVAVNEERRKEFNSEWCLCPDMIRSGYIADHIEYNYPKSDKVYPNTEEGAKEKIADLRDNPWTYRIFTYDPAKMDMPIPATEIMKNSALKQNPAYRGK